LLATPYLSARTDISVQHLMVCSSRSGSPKHRQSQAADSAKSLLKPRLPPRHAAQVQNLFFSFWWTLASIWTLKRKGHLAHSLLLIWALSCCCTARAGIQGTQATAERNADEPWLLPRLTRRPVP